MIVLDTNVVSELMRGAIHPQVIRWFSAARSEVLTTTAVTVAEITYGLHRTPVGQKRLALEQNFARLLGASGLPVLLLDEDAARATGRLRAMRIGAGLGASPPDMMIAGIAFVAGASIATRNVNDFAGLSLTIVDPWAP